MNVKNKKMKINYIAMISIAMLVFHKKKELVNTVNLAYFRKRRML
jgi:hypothetical protein